MGENEARLQKHLDEHPDDTQSRLILADLLEEQGQEESARCQRWLAQQGKWPDTDLAQFKLTGWHWWSCPDYPQHNRDHAVLPLELHPYMKGTRGEWIYPTRAEAETILAQALTRAGIAVS
jgi:uncharacterized protein (TIGR02996 family)